MGKSTIADMLSRMGVPVHDSDVAAREALQPGSAGLAQVQAAFPILRHPQIYDLPAMTVNRAKLAELVFAGGAEKHRKTLEGIIHPLVREAQNDFIRAARRAGRNMVALDIPLLYETGGERFVNYVIVASAPHDIQKKRVMARGMSEAEFEKRLSSQMPDAEKRARADFVIQTGLNRAHTQKQLKQMLADLQAQCEPQEQEEKIYDP